MSQKKVDQFYKWVRKLEREPDIHELKDWIKTNVKAPVVQPVPVYDPEEKGVFVCPHPSCNFTLCGTDVEHNASRIVYHYTDVFQHVPQVVLNLDVQPYVFRAQMIEVLERFVFQGRVCKSLTKSMCHRILQSLAAHYASEELDILVIESDDEQLSVLKRKRTPEGSDSFESEESESSGSWSAKRLKPLGSSPFSFTDLELEPLSPLFPDLEFGGV